MKATSQEKNQIMVELKQMSEGRKRKNFGNFQI